MFESRDLMAALKSVFQANRVEVALSVLSRKCHFSRQLVSRCGYAICWDDFELAVSGTFSIYPQGRAKNVCK